MANEMQAFSIDKSMGVQTAVANAMTVAALVVLALVMAYWTWQWLAPRPQAPAPALSAVTGNLPSASTLFGKAEPAAGAGVVTARSYRLLATVAATGSSRGFAIIRMDPKATFAVREGDEVAPGIRLAEVATDHVILEHGAGRESLSWPARASTADAPVPVVRKSP